MTPKAPPRTSIQVPVGTTPAEAVRLAREAKGFTPAPGRLKDKRKRRGPESGDGDTEAGGRLVARLRGVFARDSRPDVPLDEAGRAEQGRRSAYLKESEAVARAAGEKKRPKSHRVIVTKNGAVQVRDRKGRIKKSLRPAYRGEAGTFEHNIERPMTKDPANLRKTVDDRLERYGRSLFQDRAGLSPARLKALREAFKQDREARGWAVPEWKG